MVTTTPTTVIHTTAIRIPATRTVVLLTLKLVPVRKPATKPVITLVTTPVMRGTAGTTQVAEVLAQTQVVLVQQDTPPPTKSAVTAVLAVVPTVFVEVTAEGAVELKESVPMVLFHQGQVQLWEQAVRDGMGLVLLAA